MLPTGGDAAGACVGAGDAQEAPYLPPTFAVPKTALKVALIVNKYLGHSEIYKNT